jgi:predicted phosphodiesterase
MRFGVMADVHANLHALDAALAFLSTQDVDGYLCAGDLVGYGPLPNECVRRLADLPARCVAGNHDLIALERLSDENCIPLAQASLRWTRRVLDDDVRTLLENLPTGATVQGVALHHGSVTDPEEYVLTQAQALACLDDLERVAPAAEILILGHTHRPMAIGRRGGSLLRRRTGTVTLPPGEPVVLNPGAVGQSRSRDVRARVMVLDLAAREATFHALSYDVARCRQALRERGLPATSCHLPRSRREDAVGVAKRGVRRVQSSIGKAPARRDPFR